MTVSKMKVKNTGTFVVAMATSHQNVENKSMKSAR
jgi:hypothetical protein